MPVPANFTEDLVSRFAAGAAGIALIEPARSNGSEEQRLSYRELDRRARSLAVWLRERGAAGRQVLLALDGGISFAEAVLACLYSGAVAVPVPPPGQSRAAVERTAAIVAESAVHLVLTESAHAPAVSRQLADTGRGDLICLAVDNAVPDRAAEWRLPELSGASLALIQYTSGTTAAPRGAMITQGNLQSAMEAMRSALGIHPGSRIGGWLPLHHDLGLIGQLLHPLWSGATVVLTPAPVRSVAWLQAVDRHDLTVIAAPDSVYARCAAEVTDEELGRIDLSRLELAVNASEPVLAGTVNAFAERFRSAGLRPGTLVTGYGLAEATLLVSVGRGDEPGVRGLDAEGALCVAPDHTAGTVVGCGHPADGVEVRIVDAASGAEQPDGRVGEIWVRGGAVAAGYWARPLEARQVFDRSTAEGRTGFLRTGDLGALQDGELYVTGRIKDVIHVDGRSLHPQEVERSLRGSGAPFASAAVFGVGGGLGGGPGGGVGGRPEKLIAVQEIRALGRSRADLAGFVARVRRVVDEEFGLPVDGVVLVRPGTVRRTTSGKVRRAVTKELFLQGELHPLYAELTPLVKESVSGWTGRGAGADGKGRNA